MKFTDLPKQKQLLIYMFNHECSIDFGITVADYGDDIIANGITKNKNSLSNMLHSLLVKHYISLNKTTHCYFLTRAGQDEAKHWIEQCDEDECLPGGVGQPNGTEEEISVDFTSMANMFADAAKRIIQQPKKTNKLQEENAALVKEIEKLKYDLYCAKEAYEYLEDERDSLKEINERMSLNMDSVNKRLAALKQTLTERCAQLDEKTKRVEFLESSLEKIAENCHRMGKWAMQMKDGIGKTA